MGLLLAALVSCRRCVAHRGSGPPSTMHVPGARMCRVSKLLSASCYVLNFVLWVSDQRAGLLTGICRVCPSCFFHYVIM